LDKTGFQNSDMCEVLSAFEIKNCCNPWNWDWKRRYVWI